MARWLFAWGQYTDVADSVNQFNAVWVIDKDSIPLGGDFDLDRFILRRATVDFYQRFQRQVVQLVVYRGTLFYGDDERVIHSQTINWRHSPCLMIGDELLWLGAKPRWGAMRPSVKRSRCRHGTATAAAIGKQITGCVGCWVAWILDRFNLKFNKWVTPPGAQILHLLLIRQRELVQVITFATSIIWQHSSESTGPKLLILS